MDALKTASCFLVILFIAGSPSRADAPTPPDPQRLIELLADPEPTQRQLATDQLLSLGERARPALLRAMRADDPRVSPPAGEILLKMPWAHRQDSPAIQQLLIGYGGYSETDRRVVVARLAQLPDTESILLRLMQEDPSESVAWFVYETLRRTPTEPTHKLLDQVDLHDARVPTLAAVARANLLRDRTRAFELYHRVVDADRIHPSGSTGQIDAIYSLLVNQAISGGDLGSAAALRRAQIDRPAESDDASDSVFELFALHADFGPAPGFEDDLIRYQSYLGAPEVLASFARLYERHGLAALRLAYTQAGLLAGFASPLSHQRAARFCFDHGWLDQSIRENQASLALVPLLDEEQRLSVEIVVRDYLARAAGEIGDHDAAIAYLVPAVQATAPTSPNPFNVVNRNELGAQLQLHRYESAGDGRDAKLTKSALDQLIQANTLDADVMIAGFRALKDSGRANEARAYFQRSYASLKAQIADDPNAPEALNNLAWLCAQCGEKTEEAVSLSQQAITATPDQAGYIDTAAAAQFAAGSIDEAIRLESMALSMKCGDRFMLSQLRRFQKAKR